MVRGVLDKLPGISRSRELETRMASLHVGIREANAIFEERKSLHQIEVKKSAHRISPHCAHLPLLSLHYRCVLFAFFAKAVSVRKLADQSHDTRLCIAIA